MKREEKTTVDRRAFLVRGGALLAGATVGLSEPSKADEIAPAGARKRPVRIGPDATTRQGRAYQIRIDAARSQHSQPLPQHPVNGDEALYPNRMASFTKGLPHNSLGEVDLRAYDMLLAALASSSEADFAHVPMGGSQKLVNPQAAFTFGLEGADSHHLGIPAPPAFASAERGGELAEVYWQALTRDVPFAEYDTNALTSRAAEDLSRFSIFYGPKKNGRVTTQTLFRGVTPGELTGPYISQFLWKDVQQGPLLVPQKLRTALPGFEHLTTYSDWLAIQNGEAPRSIQYSTYRYIRSGRDLAAYVYTDPTYLAFLNACLILFSMQRTTDARLPYRGAPYNPGNPYLGNASQTGFVTFGLSHILDLLARVANDALKAAWFQKWVLHRTLRPEEYGGRVHNHRRGNATYPIPAEFLSSPVADEVDQKNGSYLLPQAYPSGSPLHTSYPAGHAAIGGACTTVLKAFFDESYQIQDPVVASADGLALYPWTGQALTVGGELNKLASNIGIGRDFAGIHWRSDATYGLLLGEAVAISVMQDMKSCFTEPFAGFTFTTFDGTIVTV